MTKDTAPFETIELRLADQVFERIAFLPQTRDDLEAILYEVARTAVEAWMRHQIGEAQRKATETRTRQVALSHADHVERERIRAEADAAARARYPMVKEIRRDERGAITAMIERPAKPGEADDQVIGSRA